MEISYLLGWKVEKQIQNSSEEQTEQFQQLFEI